MYRIEVSPAAERDLARLKSRVRQDDIGRIISAIDSLAGEPGPYGVRKIADTECTYPTRVGPYRIIYSIHDQQSLVVILRVMRRTEYTYS